MSWGRKRSVLKGLMNGAVAGAALFGLGDPCDLATPGEACPTRAQAVAEGALGGGLIGLAAGAAVISDRWVELPMRGGQAWLARGVGVDVKVRF